MTETIMAVLIIGQLIHSPIGIVFQPQERVQSETLQECWELAIRITRDPKTKQVAFCAPAIKEQKDAHL
jgi:hypothetical protein